MKLSTYFLNEKNHKNMFKNYTQFFNDFFLIQCTVKEATVKFTVFLISAEILPQLKKNNFNKSMILK